MENANFWRKLREWAESLPATVHADLDPTNNCYVLHGDSKPVLARLTRFSKQALLELSYKISGDPVQLFLHLLPPTNDEDKISINPLGEIIAGFCSEHEESLTRDSAGYPPTSGLNTPGVNSDGFSKAQAAKKNREREPRLRIIQQLQLLGVSEDKWPEYVREYYERPDLLTTYHQKFRPPLFQPPIFDILNQSPEDWRKLADKRWARHANDFLKTFLQSHQFWIEKGMDEKISTSKTTRSSGSRKGPRNNAPVALRFEWAARRIIGCEWKQIANGPFTESQVTKAATNVLKNAGWPTKTKKTNSNSKTPSLSTSRKATKRK